MSEHYFTASPATPAEERRWQVTIRGTQHTVTTASGVFSCDRLDKGTQVLLDHVPNPPREGVFVDVGCGWGPIALALADASPKAHVYAADVNERSLDLTARNARECGATGVEAVQADELLDRLRREGTVIDLIWSNPPVRIGKEALHALLHDWLSLLAPTGEAWLVVGKNLGADSLARWLHDQGFSVERAASSKGFRVLRVAPGLARAA